MSRIILSFPLFALATLTCSPAISAPKFIETREPVEVINANSSKKISLDLGQPTPPKASPAISANAAQIPSKPGGTLPLSGQTIGLFVQPIILSVDEAKRGLNEEAFIKKARIAFARTDLNKDGILNEDDKPKPPKGFVPPAQPNILAPQANNPTLLRANTKNNPTSPAPAAPSIVAPSVPPAPIAPVILPTIISPPLVKQSK